MPDLHPSVRATYDSARTGPRYWTTVTVNDYPIEFRNPLPDPFARTKVTVSWADTLRALIRGRHVVVEVTIGAHVAESDVIWLRELIRAERPMVGIEAPADGTQVELVAACCDMHNIHCEPPSELCCGRCTEVGHGIFGHTDGTACVLDAQGDVVKRGGEGS
jgi:hypothetical protein